ncbi:hypothetical protein I4U23_008503 [Adineta vaga]|nr:hypothetical protein I4U23_008503 [Adineta vaga]
MIVKLTFNVPAFRAIILILLLLFANGKEQGKVNRDICPTTTITLCAREVLQEIRTTANQIHPLTLQIEENIHRRDPNKVTLENNIIYKTTILNITFPSSKTHDQFMHMNNIDKSDLVHLIKEADYAVSYLYKSIVNLRQAETASKEDGDNALFHRIEQLLEEGMICNYRDILHTYAEKWSSTNDIDGIEVGRTRKRDITSCIYHTQIVITVRLLRQWMELINYTVDILEKKLL